MIKLLIAIGIYIVIGVTFWQFKLLKRKYLEPVFIGFMILGIVALCQPIIFKLYSYGFAFLLTGTGGYMFASHMK
jgi:hypothetical protein